MADLAALRGSGIQANCAVLVSGSFPLAPLGQWSVQELEATWRLNLTFPLLVSQALAPELADGGCLQLLLDTAIHKPFSQHLPYSVAKTGLAASWCPAWPGCWRPGSGWSAMPWARCCRPPRTTPGNWPPAA